MLTAQENALITGVGPGTWGGEVIRHYWLPLLLSYELAADGPPLRIRLMSEDLIAFRTTSGRVGLVQNACPHRGASLFFGRNEEEGLRCVYHGWKFDASGACVDMPSEPAESNFKGKVRARAYPCRERNGVVWTYMGSQTPIPELPEFEWNTVPEAHCYVSKRVQSCNWFQALEGGIDSSHRTSSTRRSIPTRIRTGALSSG
jgi:phenylpropionate dioxygenase-like ring-hydroxylating dioxygenase large terminal subunit